VAQVVAIGKKKYAAGLSWGPLDPDKPLRPQAVELARKAKDAFYVLYGEVEPMVGHCDAQNSVRKGMPALAPLVAEIWPSNTLLAVILDERTAIGIQITNGNIYDDVVGPPSEIRTWFDALQADRTWDHASSPWGPGEFHPNAFVDQISDKTYRPPKLRSVNESRGLVLRLGVLVLAALVVFLGLSAFIRHKKAMEERLAEMSRHVIRKVIPPSTVVPIKSFVRACRGVLERIPAEASGWEARTVSCRPDEIRVVWVRDRETNGTVRDLERSLSVRVSLLGPDRARMDLPLSVPATSVPVVNLPELSEEKKDLASVLEQYGLKYQMEEGSILPGLSASETSESDFSIDLPELPGGRFLKDLAGLSGLSARELLWSGNDRWTLKGDLKHAPIAFKSKGIPSGTPPFASPGVGPGGNRESSSASAGKPSGSGGPGQRETLRRPNGLTGGNKPAGGPSGTSGDADRTGESVVPPVRLPPAR
jgi:hypothetical protein